MEVETTQHSKSNDKTTTDFYGRQIKPPRPKNQGPKFTRRYKAEKGEENMTVYSLLRIAVRMDVVLTLFHLQSFKASTPG